MARIVSKRLAERLGHATVVVENRGGAGGTLGATHVARAAADGHVILNASSGNLTSAPQIIGAAYDPFKDFVPVGFLGHVRFVLAAHPGLGVRTLPELIAYAKQHPGKINYGTAGNGTGGHIAGEYLKLRTGIDIVHVPYRGSALALQDAVAGHVQFVLDPLAAAYVKSGALRGLAFTGASRSPDLPGVPAIDQAGVPRWEATNFFVAVVRATTPPEIVQTLHRAFLQIAHEPAVQAELQALGVEIKPLSQAEIVRLLLTETAVNNRVIEAARLPLAKPLA
ncbi:MAG: tripartite tricarboxylate transporter substrate binding protein [Xenophilus sp.]